MWLPLVLLFFTFVDCQRSDGVYPRNIAIISGQNFTFVCGNLSNKDSTQWKFHKENSYGELQLYNGSHVIEAFKDFSVETVAKQYSTLVKANSSKSDAGIYTCIEKAKRGSLTCISSAQLIVLGNDPVCKVHKENVMDGEFLQMDCIVDYTGGITPVIKWSRSDGIDPRSHDNINTSSSNGSLISILTAQMTKEDNSVTFKATVYFSGPSSSSDKSGIYKATNAPDYNFNWTHKANVLFAPKSVVVAPTKDIYSIGDIVYCVAHGNPPPSYEWMELESSFVVSRVSSLVIDSTKMGNRTYKCTVTYVSVKEEQTFSTTVTIHAVKSAGHLSSGFDPVSSVTIAAGVVCVVLFLVISVVVVKRFKGCLHSFIQRRVETEPDIVQNADMDDNHPSPEENLQQYAGYAQPGGPGLGRPSLQQGRFAAEAAGHDVNANCKQGSIPEEFPIYDEINNPRGGASVGISVYGKVNKSSKVQSPEEGPVYGKVQKKNDERAPCSGNATSASKAGKCENEKALESTSSSKKAIVGADGTEYIDMTAARTLMQTEAGATSAQHPLYNKSQYAEIDHTKSASK